MQGLLAENERLRTLVDSLKAESEAQVSNLASLYVAVTSVHGALDRPSVLVGAGDRHQSDRSEEMAIFETDVSNGRLTLLASIGIEPGPYQEIGVGEGAIGKAAATGARLIRPEGGSLTEGGDAALTACIPLKIAGRIVGVLLSSGCFRTRVVWTRSISTSSTSSPPTPPARSSSRDSTRRPTAWLERRVSPRNQAAASAVEHPAGVSPPPPTGTLPQAHSARRSHGRVSRAVPRDHGPRVRVAVGLWDPRPASVGSTIFFCHRAAIRRALATWPCGR